MGQVSVGGSALPGVRVEVNPTLLNNFGLGLEDVSDRACECECKPTKRAGLRANHRTLSLSTSDQLFKADQYRSLIIKVKNGSPVRVGDVADVVDSVEDIRQAGLVCTADGVKPAVLLVIFRQPGANIISTVDAIKKMMPLLQASIPPSDEAGDRA